MSGMIGILSYRGDECCHVDLMPSVGELLKACKPNGSIDDFAQLVCEAVTLVGVKEAPKWLWMRALGDLAEGRKPMHDGRLPALTAACNAVAEVLREVWDDEC